MSGDPKIQQKPFQPVKPDVDLPAMETKILEFWEQSKIFEQSLRANDPAAKPFSFYDGPPFATGLPHYGHLLQSVQKDIVPRYWTMMGHRIARRWGWDCHGVPVEYEINKANNISSRKQVLEMGIGKYNDLCRGIVQRCATDWKRTVRRLGRWVDMDNAYFTMDPGFMESVWWVFNSLWKKGLIYEGYKVVPYSTGISTGLSNFEASQNYKDVQDPAITITFPIKGQAGVELLAWTTTPWTLPANLALAVHRDLEYVRVSEKSTGKHYWLGRSLLASVWKNPDAEVSVEETVLGEKLLGLEYEPLFPFFAAKRTEGAFRVIHGDHVTADSGTGIVHTAPGHGEEDYYACLREKIPVVCPVDDDGQYTSEVPTYQGRYVKDCEKDLIADIKARHRLLRHETLNHSYAFCPRTDTPLINSAITSWFVAVEKFKDTMIAANKQTRWIPDHLRDGRFGNWLDNARDWAISRNRFWGTPLPAWKNLEGEVLCVGSRAELEKLSGQSVPDLHLEFVGKIELPSPTGKSPLKHVGSVLDCWFESGAMPYAQWNYPFSNKVEFEKAFPADFIGEALDQTRGWFYTLTVLGSALFGKSPFKNVIVTGLILAEDGRKMSKSLRNYPDPNTVLEKHGADALRLYMIDSPVVRGQELRFSEKGVHDIVRQILLRWWNSYGFFVNYANVDGFRPRGDAARSPNILDQWVLSRLNTLIEKTRSEMSAYRLYNVVPGLLAFIEELTNTYIRFNRSHFWSDGMPEDKRLAYETLYEVLVKLAQIMAPFAPFMAEETYRNLVGVMPVDAKEKATSVHLSEFPEAHAELKKPDLEEAVSAMETLVQLGRNLRENLGIRSKIPLNLMTIYQREARVIDQLKKLQPYFQSELNVREVRYDTAEEKQVQLTAKANFPVLGKRVGPKMKVLAAAISKLAWNDLLRLEAGETLTLEGETITASDVEVRRSARDASRKDFATHARVSIALDSTVTPEQIAEGLAREVCRKVQAARKAADFQLDDRIELEVSAPAEIAQAAETHRKMIERETLAVRLQIATSILKEAANPTKQDDGWHQEDADIDEAKIRIRVRVARR